MLEQIIGAMSNQRFPMRNEKVLQAALSERFTALNIDHQREVHLAPGDIVDFMFEDIAGEVKIKGSKREIFLQLERYAAHQSVSRLILITSVPMGLPAAIKGKPAYLFNLSRAWL